MSSYPIGLTDIALYLRKSRADLEAEARGEGETLSKHRRALLELAKKNRYAITDVFEEIVSGERIVDRPEMQKLLHNVRDGAYRAVLCMDIDRLGRGNMIDQGLIQEAFKTSKTLIITPRKVYDLQDEMDEEWSEFESFMARRELKIITRRMQRGRRASAKEGKFIVRKAPFGYVKGDDKKLYPDPEHAKTVRTIFDMYAAGNGLVKITRMLSDMGITPPENQHGQNRWTYATINDILQNEAYLGRVIFGKYRHYKDAGHRKKELLPRDEWVIVEEAHEPLVAQEVWEQCQRNRALSQPRSKIDYTLQNPLAGIVRCGHCGRMMRKEPARNGRKSRFVCQDRTCVCASSFFQDVEETILLQLTRIADNLLPKSPFETDDTTSIERERDALQKRLQRIRAELDEKDVQLTNMHRLVELGTYDPDTFLSRSREVNNEKKLLESEFESVSADLEQYGEHILRQSRILPALNAAVSEYRVSDDVTLKNRILKNVVESVVYRKNKGIDETFELELKLKT